MGLVTIVKFLMGLVTLVTSLAAGHCDVTGVVTVRVTWVLFPEVTDCSMLFVEVEGC